jgi:hypothetical protein
VLSLLRDRGLVAMQRSFAMFKTLRSCRERALAALACAGLLCSCAPAGGVAEEAATAGMEQDPQDLLHTIRLANGSEYRFVGMSDEAGVVQSVGILEMAPPGAYTLADVDAGDLDPLRLFYALTDEGVAAPRVLARLYADTAADQQRGWLAVALAAVSADKLSCNDDWFLARFGDTQAGYAHHDGPDSGAWLNRWWSKFVWRRDNIDRVHMGVCVQSAATLSLVRFECRRPGESAWIVKFENYYVSEGAYYHWYCNTCTDYDWRITVDAMASSNQYDIGFDYST